MHAIWAPQEEEEVELFWPHVPPEANLDLPLRFSAPSVF